MLEKDHHIPPSTSGASIVASVMSSVPGNFAIQVGTSAAVSNPVQWSIPKADEVVRSLREKEDEMGAWAGRGERLVETVWPVLEITSRLEKKPIDLEMYRRITDLPTLEEFGRRFPDSEEGARVNEYLSTLPGYRKGQQQNEHTKLMHGYVEMSVSFILGRHDKGAE